MLTRKTLILIVLAGLSWPLSITAFPFGGVLAAKVSVEPERIAPGGKTLISIRVNDGLQKPIPNASIKISAETGYFEASNQTTVFGFTDQDGLFQMTWHGNLQTDPGPQTFDVTASKNGYIAKYPVTATAKVIVGDQPHEEDACGGKGNCRNPSVQPPNPETVEER